MINAVITRLATIAALGVAVGIPGPARAQAPASFVAIAGEIIGLIDKSTHFTADAVTTYRSVLCTVHRIADDRARYREDSLLKAFNKTLVEYAVSKQELSDSLIAIGRTLDHRKWANTVLWTRALAQKNRALVATIQAAGAGNFAALNPTAYGQLLRGLDSKEYAMDQISQLKPQSPANFRQMESIGRSLDAQASALEEIAAAIGRLLSRSPRRSRIRELTDLARRT
jgi:hypothetical protein